MSRPCCRGSDLPLPPAPSASSRPVAPRPPGAPPSSSASPAAFRYLGRTALTVYGRVTGRTYRFRKPGEVVGVDPRDLPSFKGLPMLEPA